MKYKEQEDFIMERVEKFLKEAEIYYLATVEGDQPRVRPFGTIPVSYTHLDVYKRQRKNRKKGLP